MTKNSTIDIGLNQTDCSIGIILQADTILLPFVWKIESVFWEILKMG